MDKSAQESELLNLLSSVWDNELDVETRARIEALLEQNDFAAIQTLTMFTRLHLDLEWLASSKTAQDKALKSLRQIRAASPPRIRQRIDRRVLGLAALAATIFLGGFYLWNSRWAGHEYLVRPAQAVGEVVRLESTEWTGGSELKAGDPVLNGQTIEIKKGLAQISLGFGADVMLEGPCRAQIVAGDCVALEHGKVAVRAAEWAKGFRVETKNLVATDLGTWFSVQSDQQLSEVHVIEGLVLAEPVMADASRNEIRRLRADQAVDLASDGAFREVKFRRDPVAVKLTEFQPLRPIPIWNSGINLSVGEPDPHWTVSAAGGQTQPAFVNAPHGSYGVNDPARSQWISVDDGTSDGVPARTRYTFETTFDLTGYNLDSVVVSGLILADDGVDEVRLNGRRLNIAPWKNWGYGVVYASFHPIEFRSGFNPGINRISFVVKNETFIYRSDRGFDLPEIPNPMAFRAEWEAFGRPTGRTVNNP
jgi:hypothetical protein